MLSASAGAGTGGADHDSRFSGDGCRSGSVEGLISATNRRRRVGCPAVSLGEPVSLTLRSALTYHRLDVLTAMDL